MSPHRLKTRRGTRHFLLKRTTLVRLIHASSKEEKWDGRRVVKTRTTTRRVETLKFRCQCINTMYRMSYEVQGTFRLAESTQPASQTIDMNRGCPKKCDAVKNEASQTPAGETGLTWECPTTLDQRKIILNTI